MTGTHTMRDREYWNRRHARRAAEGPPLRPRSLVTDHSSLLPDLGRALDAAAGLALNGLYLARHGLSVTAVDLAESGLQLAMKTARQEGLDFHAVVADLSRFYLPPETFVVIVNTMYLDRSLLPGYRSALKPGGLLFFESLLADSAGEDSHYVQAGEMRATFPDYSTEYEGSRFFTSGERSEMRQTYQIILRKPTKQGVQA